MSNISTPNNFNISFSEFVKLIVQIVIVIVFIVTMQQNQLHINSELDQISKRLDNIEAIKERVVILETKLQDKAQSKLK